MFEHHILSICNIDTITVRTYSNAVMQKSQELNRPKIVVRATKRQRVRAGIALIVLAGLFGLVALMATGIIDPDRVLDPCGFKQRHGLPCPTCGMTHSALAFARGRVFEAFYIQPTAALICCIMIIAFFLALLTAVFGIYLRPLDFLFSGLKARYVVVILILVIVAGWAVTLARALAANMRG